MARKGYRYFLIPLYSWGLQSRKRVEKSLGPAKNKYFYPLIAKPAIHVVVILLIFAVTAVNLQAQTLPNTGGQNSLLFQALGGSDTELIQETADQSTSQTSTSYLGVAFGVNEHQAAQAQAAIPVNEQTALLLAGGSVIGAPSPSITGEIRATSGAQPRKDRTSNEDYVVQSGDTISTIAASFGLSSSTILWANNLGSHDYIRPGQKLTILPTDGVEHTVTSGENLSKIAKAYDVTEAKIRQYNQLDEEDTLQKGQVLLIPGGTPPRQAPAPVRLVQAAPSLNDLQRIFTQPSPSTQSGSGSMIWPTSGHVITQYFGLAHTGLDIDGDYSSPIYAADDGVIERAGWATGYGLEIVINHLNGIKTRYGHSSKIFVNIGDHVTKGEVIAMVGTTGHSTGTHLHFEVIVNGVRKNPLLYIRSSEPVKYVTPVTHF